MRAKRIGAILMLILCLFALPVMAQEDEDEDDDIEFFGIEGEELLALISAHLALALAFLTFVAYGRTNNSKLLLVGIAFSLFSLRLFMEASELFIGEIELLDPLSVVLDFIVLLLFFIGVVKK